MSALTMFFRRATEEDLVELEQYQNTNNYKKITELQDYLKKRKAK
jgi:hypothetical protein